MCVSGLCQWAGWPFSFLGFRSRCTNKAECTTSSGSGVGGSAYLAVLRALKTRGGRTGLPGMSGPQAHHPSRDQGQGLKAPPLLGPAPPRPRLTPTAARPSRADWLWRGPISALRPALSEPALHRASVVGALQAHSRPCGRAGRRARGPETYAKRDSRRRSQSRCPFPNPRQKGTCRREEKPTAK